MAAARQVAKRAAISNGVTAKCEAVRTDAGALKLRPKSRGIDTHGKKPWSGRRESNPRMQLGKLRDSQEDQNDSCKTGQIEPQSDQRVTDAAQNPSPKVPTISEELPAQVLGSAGRARFTISSTRLATFTTSTGPPSCFGKVTAKVRWVTARPPTSPADSAWARRSPRRPQR